MPRFIFRFWIPLSGALSLSACAASRPAYDPQQVQLQLEAQAPEAYNIVWLRATLRNNGPYTLWLPASQDSIYEEHPRNPLGLQGLTPKGDSLAQCDPAFYKLGYPRYTKLLAGAERIFYFRVDFSQVFPRAFLDSLITHTSGYDAPCSRFINRTMGAYQFRLIAGGWAGRRPWKKQRTELRRKQYRLRVVSNPETVHRKQ